MTQIDSESVEVDEDVDDGVTDGKSVQIEGPCCLRAWHIFGIAALIFLVSCVLLGLSFRDETLKGARNVIVALLALGAVLMVATGIVCAAVELRSFDMSKSKNFNALRWMYYCCEDERDRAIRRARAKFGNIWETHSYLPIRIWGAIDQIGDI